MISDRNFTKASAANIKRQASETREFLRKMESSKIICWDEFVAILELNKDMLEFAASELSRVADKRPQIEELRERIMRVQHLGRAH